MIVCPFQNDKCCYCILGECCAPLDANDEYCYYYGDEIADLKEMFR